VGYFAKAEYTLVVTNKRNSFEAAESPPAQTSAIHARFGRSSSKSNHLGIVVPTW